MSAPWEGTVAIITGASHGIGEHVALQLAAAGATLVLAARRADELERVAHACRNAGARDVLAVVADVALAPDCDRLVAQAAAAFGRIDTLVNNAGLGMWGRVDELRDLSVFERVMRVNYLGSVYCAAYALPYLKKTRGRIVCVSSLSARTGVPLRSGYAASKHALAGFFDSLRIELDGSGVSVTLVDPGFVMTGFQGRNLGADGAPLGVSPIKASESMTPEACARRVVRAAALRKREDVIGALPRVAMMLKAFAPGLVDALSVRAMRRKPSDGR